MADILFLCHRIPFPPDKGDKIRSWNILRHLARRHRVHLGCFIDDPRDHAHREHLRAVAGGECHFAELSPSIGKLRALPALLKGTALTLDYYRDSGLQHWADGLLARRRPDAALAFSSAMAPYLMGKGWSGVRRVLDMVDIDSDKWAQCARQGRWPLAAVHRREARTLLAFERRAAAAFDATVLVSPHEAELFRTLAPDVADKVSDAANGVDAEFFSPDRRYDDPYRPRPAPLVFTGAMDYWPNVDAAVWFARDILPRIQSRRPQTGFAIVGSNPAREVQALADLPGVRVTGRVPDVRPYLAHAAAAVAPLRVARGIQNKVLEAMAMARPVIATPAAVQGIDAEDGTHLRLADGAESFAETVLAVLAAAEAAAALGQRARDRVLWAYGWQRNLERLEALLGVATSADMSLLQAKVG